MPGPRYENWDPLAPMESPMPLYTKRIKKETTDITMNPPPGIFTAMDEQDITTFYAIIVGPEGTPYEGGFFYFFIRFPPNYPFSPPKVKLMTTGGSKVRFNPNLYANGKVCLSILGTWSGPAWCAGSTITSVLISIQSLLNEEPYQNEPGHERLKGPPGFNQMLTHETMRVAVVGMLDNDYRINMPESLRDKMEQEFVKRFPFYERLVTANTSLTGRPMTDPASYSPAHGRLSTRYDYSGILKRLRTIWTRLNKPAPAPVPVQMPALAPLVVADENEVAVAAVNEVIDLTDCDEPPRKKAK